MINRGAFTSLILGRIVYAVNWFNLAAVFSLLASELNQDVSGLGLATATFYIGIGSFQVPGGIVAAKIGPRLTAICGTTIASLGALLTGFANNLIEIAVLRFFVGLGMAFVFAPSIILITRLLQKGSEGLGVGLYNSAFYVGSVIGLSGWSVFASTVGWRNSLISGGLLGLFTSVLLLLSIPKDTRRSDFKVDLLHVKPILLNKWLIAMSIALLALNVGNTVVGAFMAYYVENVLHIDVGEAGTIASLTSLSALLTAPLWGRLFDKFSDAKQLLFASGVIMALGVGIASLGTVYSAMLSGILVGLAAGAGFTFGFSAVRAAYKTDQEYETLAVSWVNSIALFGDFVPPLLFSYLAIQYGYAPAWLCLTALSFALMIPILFAKVPRQKRFDDH
jgi:MFS family permease